MPSAAAPPAIVLSELPDAYGLIATERLRDPESRGRGFCDQLLQCLAGWPLEILRPPRQV
jgi:hypothetical protein